MKCFLLIVFCCVFVNKSSAQSYVSETGNGSRQETVQYAPDAERQTQIDAQESSLYASLITCSPGSEAYTKFGHTALRLRDFSVREYDLVFNYGVFDYNSDNFIFRFVCGKTDYVLAAEPTSEFLNRYVRRGFTVWEQELNLSQAQLRRLRHLLEENYRPENRTYRYNFLYDNCTSRARGMIERTVGRDSLYYNKEEETTTFREILHRFTASDPWLSFGIDMVLGAEVDRKANKAEQMFIPSIYQSNMDHAWVLTAQGRKEPIVVQTQIFPPLGALEQSQSFPLTPRQVGYLMLGIALLVTVIDVIRRKTSLWLDITLYLLQGLAGVIVAFLFFFSVHPAVGSNWLVLAFNPLAFLLILDVLKQRRCGRPLMHVNGYSAFQLVNLAVLLFTLLLFCLPLQWIHPALLPMVLTLVVRCVLHLTQRRSLNQSMHRPAYKHNR